MFLARLLSVFYRGPALVDRAAQRIRLISLACVLRLRNKDTTYVRCALSCTMCVCVMFPTSGWPQGTPLSLSRLKPRLIVGTPGRLLEHFESTYLFPTLFERLQTLVLDEGDRLFSLGFLKEIKDSLGFRWRVASGGVRKRPELCSGSGCLYGRQTAWAYSLEGVGPGHCWRRPKFRVGG